MSLVLEFPSAHKLVETPACLGRWQHVVSHTDPRYGGLSAAVPALAGHLAQAGFESSLAAFCLPGENFQPAEILSSRTSFWPTSRGAWLSASLRQSFETQLRGLDGVHIHGLWEQSTNTGARAARRLQIPYILSAHGMLEPWALRNKRLKKQVYAALFEGRNVARAACLHALTQAEAGHYIRFGARSPIAVIPNGVDIPARPDPTSFLERFPSLRGRRIVLFLGRLHPKKGLHLLVDAWSHVASQFPEAQLVIAGADFEDTRARIEAQVAVHHTQTSTHDFASSITFTGMLNSTQKWSALAAAEAFVLPSLSEGLSVGALEAMGMGLPVIVTEPCNMPEVVEHRTGWLIQPTVPDLTSALDSMLRNTPQHNTRVGARGAQLVKTHFSWETVSRQMADLYHFVQGGPSPTSLQLIQP